MDEGYWHNFVIGFLNILLENDFDNKMCRDCAASFIRSRFMSTPIIYQHNDPEVWNDIDQSYVGASIVAKQTLPKMKVILFFVCCRLEKQGFPCKFLCLRQQIRQL